MSTNEPVRVLQVFTCDAEGGTEHMVATLVEEIDRRTVEPSVVTLAPPGPIAARLAKGGVRVRSLGGSGLALAFARLARILTRERYEVVNAYGFKSTAVTRILVRVTSPRTKFVSGVRGLHVAELKSIDSFKARGILVVERLLSPLVDAYDANSRGAIELLAETGIDRSRLHYIPNGIDQASWRASRQDGRNEPIASVLCVARFVPRKRHADLVEAAARLVERSVRFRLDLVGDGPTLAETRASAASAGVAGVVTFAGGTSHEGIRSHLADADVFCLPSAWEGMAGSVMEAMAMGLPVVGTNVNGIAELVDHERTGLLVPPRRPDLLADALERLLLDPKARQEMGAAGRARIVEEFSVERMVSAKEELFARLARGR
jgi:glycosyltransferase involved in cell wall biosynthesis